MDLLLPERHPNRDFFIADIFDGTKPFKDDVASMEHPVFSLATKPDMRQLTYEHKGKWVKVHPSGHGLATIFDKDVLLYCTSVMMERINAGEILPKTIDFSAHNLLVSTNRQTSGDGYQRLRMALLRLMGTTIETNVKTNDLEIIDGFHIIENFRIVKETREGRMERLQITLSDWLYNAIAAKEVLTISRDYFRLRKPTERRLYELARKHCGNQESWSVGLETLHRKVGSSDTQRKFAMYLRGTTNSPGIAQSDHLPHYAIKMGTKHLTFVNRKALSKQTSDCPVLSASTFEKAKRAAPGHDVYALEQEWLAYWHDTGRPEFTRGAEAAFIGFCKGKAKRNPVGSMGDLFG